MNKYYLYLLCCSLFLATTAIAQSNQPGLTAQMESIIPASPNAVALAKFIELPVSYYTGIPQVSIPIYQIKEGDITLPVSLDYHAGGLKVEELASSVGLGWALSAGGAITRSTRGLADEGIGYPKNLRNYLNGTMTSTEKMTYVLNVYKGVEDSESDLYYVSAGSLSFKFVIDANGKFVAMPRNDVRIESDKDGYAWIVTDGKGIKYKFSDLEYTTSTSQSASEGGGGSPSSYNDAGYFHNVSSWYLNQIEDTHGNKINFNYTGEGNHFMTTGAQSISIPFVGPPVGGLCNTITNFLRSDNIIEGKTISSITFTNGKLIFTPDSIARSDNSWGYAMKYIKLLDNNYQVKKSFQLFTSYFSGNRLRLDSVMERSPSQHLPPYVFTYDESLSLPLRTSYASDHWGFYNGKTTNTSNLSYQFYNGSYYVDMGADKRPDPQFSVLGTLTKIKYPTGGSMDLAYEGNKFLTHDTSYINRYVGRDTSLLNFHGSTNSSSSDVTINAPFTVDSGLVGGHPAIRTIVRVDIDGSGPDCSCGVYITLTGGTGYAETFFTASVTGQFPINLPPGNYNLAIHIITETNGVPNIVVDGTITGKYAPYVTGDYVEADGPGIRIKSITKHFLDGPDEQIHYDYNTSGGYTSGQIGNLPSYRHQNYEWHQISDDDGTTTYYCGNDVYTAASNYPLINSRSSFIGYSRVTEYNDVNGINGKRVYTFSNYDQYNDLNPTPSFPFVPSSSVDWKRGLPYTESTYKYNGGTAYVLKQYKSSVYYNSQDTILRTIPALKVGASTIYDFTVPDVSTYNGIEQQVYNSVSDAMFLVSDTTITYESPAGLKAVSNYVNSEKNYQLKQIQTTNSDQTVNTRKLYYPIDYAANASSSPVLDSMLRKNIIDLPIEQINTRQQDTSTRITDAILYQHELQYDSTAVTKRVYVKKIFDNNAFDSNKSATYDFITIPGRYIEKYNYTGYNNKGEPLGYQLRQNTNTSYLWGYNNVLPVAECKNAVNTEFFAQNYEEPGSGGTTSAGAHTGKAYYSGSTTMISWTIPNNRTYVIDYWYYNGSTWQYRKDAYTSGSYTLTGGSAYDDVRIYPADAQISSYTYDPLVGMTSAIDPKGQTTYYEYDGFQRLVNIKDQYGNIVKHTDYHYANQ